MKNSLTPTQQQFLANLRDKKAVPRNIDNRTGVALKKKGLAS